MGKSRYAEQDKWENALSDLSIVNDHDPIVTWRQHFLRENSGRSQPTETKGSAGKAQPTFGPVVCVVSVLCVCVCVAVCVCVCVLRAVCVCVCVCIQVRVYVGECVHVLANSWKQGKCNSMLACACSCARARLRWRPERNLA